MILSLSTQRSIAHKGAGDILYDKFRRVLAQNRTQHIFNDNVELNIEVWEDILSLILLCDDKAGFTEMYTFEVGRKFDGIHTQKQLDNWIYRHLYCPTSNDLRRNLINGMSQRINTKEENTMQVIIKDEEAKTKFGWVEGLNALNDEPLYGEKYTFELSSTTIKLWFDGKEGVISSKVIPLTSDMQESLLNVTSPPEFHEWVKREAEEPEYVGLHEARLDAVDAMCLRAGFDRRAYEKAHNIS